MDLPIESRAGGIVFQKKGETIEYLLVTSNSNKNKWIFPAGHIERGETAEEAALREVIEEAGVEAQITADLGKFQYYWYRDNRKIIIETQLFLMEYQKTLITNPEGRQVAFYSFEQILNLNTWEESKEFLKKAHSLS